MGSLGHAVYPLEKTQLMDFPGPFTVPQLGENPCINKWHPQVSAAVQKQFNLAWRSWSNYNCYSCYSPSRKQFWIYTNHTRDDISENTRESKRWTLMKRSFRRCQWKTGWGSQSRVKAHLKRHKHAWHSGKEWMNRRMNRKIQDVHLETKIQQSSEVLLVKDILIYLAKNIQHVFVSIPHTLM